MVQVHSHHQHNRAHNCATNNRRSGYGDCLLLFQNFMLRLFEEVNIILLSYIVMPLTVNNQRERERKKRGSEAPCLALLYIIDFWIHFTEPVTRATYALIFLSFFLNWQSLNWQIIKTHGSLLPSQNKVYLHCVVFENVHIFCHWIPPKRIIC